MNFDTIMEIGRDNRFTHISKKLSPIHQNLLTARYLGPLLLSFVPALFSGCYKFDFNTYDLQEIDNTETTIYLAGSAGKATGSILDIFIFEDDRLSKLDAYQRTEYSPERPSRISSTGGGKIFFICANGHRNKYEWAEINSYNSLERLYSELDDEFSDRPLMTGECRIKAGCSNGTLTLIPLAAEVILKSISCDFSGTAYAGSHIKNVKVYLTNVNKACPILYTDRYAPSQFINVGQLNPHDLNGFRDPGIIFRKIAGEVSRTPQNPGIRLLCYPNKPISDSPGTPYTRIVIEGDIDDRTYYWPVTVGNDENNGHAGVERGSRYIYDIRIRRKGVTDPDIVFNPESIEINMNVKAWIEKEEYNVRF